MEPCPAIEGIPGSATTSRHPPTQAAKKLRIEPRRFPVPPTESPVDGAGAGRGRKDGPPDSYLEPLNPHGSPFFFGFQKPFFFQQGKRNGFCRPRKVRTAASSQVSHHSPCPCGQVSLVPLFVLSPQGWSALWGSPGWRAFLTPLPCSSSPHATRCAGLARGPHFCMWFGASRKPRPTNEVIPCRCGGRMLSTPTQTL